MTDKRKIELAGILEFYGGGLTDASPTIGDVNLIGELERTWPSWTENKPPVKVYLGVEPIASGPLWAIYGFAGTDVTPYDSPEITVGDIDLLDRLRDLDGREVLVIVEDVVD